MDWILASGSPRRRELLGRLVANFRVEVPQVEEWEPTEADPVEQVEWNARLKMRAVARRNPAALIVAADTTVALGRALLAKPVDLVDARRMLSLLSGREHHVFTGVAIFCDGRERVFHERSGVAFRELDGEAIEDYVRTVEVLDKAGAYAIQDGGERIVADWQGSFENIMGLPIQRLARELVQMGVNVGMERESLESGRDV